jgi:hypothetical protein
MSCLAYLQRQCHDLLPSVPQGVSDTVGLHCVEALVVKQRLDQRDAGGILQGKAGRRAQHQVGLTTLIKTTGDRQTGLWGSAETHP